MKNWKKEMINIIMNGEEIHETIAKIVTEKYEKEDVYLDNLAAEIAKEDLSISEELKEYLEGKFL